ncbi:MAG TPA: formimidoylglutamase [Nevskiaceae bacterium]|nr:formimidoylglutamase [Nevskiaceae bacterium]
MDDYKAEPRAPQMDIFNPKHLTPPDPILFYSRKDPLDPRIGDVVSSNFDAYGSAQVVIIGCPQDDGVLRAGGRPGSVAAPAEIRRSLYRMSTAGIGDLRIQDVGDIVPQNKLEATHALQQQWVQQFLTDGKRVITLGGGSDIAYPDCSALSYIAPNLAAINVDSHFDVRNDPACNSQTAFNQLLEENCVRPEALFQIAYQQHINSPADERYLRERGVNMCSLKSLRELGVAPAFRHMLRSKNRFDAIFWAFSMEAVRGADAPGVSLPSPLGLTAEEFCLLAEIAGRDERTRVVEFSNVNPASDIDSITSRLAAVAVHFYLAALAEALHVRN